MDVGVIDQRGYRLNVGMVILNKEGQVLLGRRPGVSNAWQFPQGGLLPNETPKEALFRELFEELGLRSEDVEYLSETRGWLSYRLPERFRRYDTKPLCVGQRQKWFLLRLLVDDQRIRLDRAEKPEFDDWHWVDYWYPMEHVVAFKRKVYHKVLRAFEDYI